MGERELNAQILAEARQVTGRLRLRQKDIAEWRSGEGLAAHAGETIFHLPGLGVDIAVTNEAPKSRAGSKKEKPLKVVMQPKPQPGSAEDVFYGEAANRLARPFEEPPSDEVRRRLVDAK